MKKLITMAIAAIMSVCNISCAQNKSNNTTANQEDMNGKKILVAYFSRADENYNVGYIEKGNTEKMAEVIVAQTGADAFKVENVTPYAADYQTCIAQAKKETEQGARPAIKGDKAIEDYDVIFLGWPIWWGDAPMALYTFIEKHDWQGKTVIPFVTHEGSHFGGTDKLVASATQGATWLKGLAIQGKVAQSNQAQTEREVKRWLAELGY